MVTITKHIEIVDRGAQEGPVSYGRNQLLKVLEDLKISCDQQQYWSSHCSFVVWVGTTEDPQTKKMLRDRGLEKLHEPEGTFLQRYRFGATTLLLLAGTDDQGLMYVLLEFAEQLKDLGPAAFYDANEFSEWPDVRMRGVDRYVMGHLDEEWWLSKSFWSMYMGRLAKARFNRFVLIFGFDTAYFTPPYPYVVHTPDFPGVSVTGLTAQKRDEFLQ